MNKRVAITLWFLATNAEYCPIGHLFGIARCAACIVVHETCSAIVSTLLNRYIHFPKDSVVEGF